MTQSNFFIKYTLEICFFAFLIANLYGFCLFLKSNPLILKSVNNLENIDANVEPLLHHVLVEKSTKNKLRKNFSINLSWIEDFVYYAPKNNMKASEILMIKINDTTNISAIRKCIDDHVEKLMKSFNDYAPEESFILKNHTVKVMGNFIFYISSPNSAEISQTIDNIFLYK